ncbi:hypothetical protein A2118_00595 [Candidatus Kaiserbacteria bacterium GWA2_50_9]|uniref:tRNA N6-adenosine threonylcarbamoyltransferase n=1 Tax=Candidatus Kaiserbacteria bacterium GWA2_50_9 TaxID=1798474 RepID=A0A1F6BVV1_9BACT|nr:MAG: hypothetical protein A2118_00595 [Candidatus Kaiserbacteria bacterium GWA2_50_9]
MKVLGIETSCDETAICLIEAAGKREKDFTFRILGNALHSQASVHSLYGGVFPNLAKREHAENLVPLLQSVLEQAERSTEKPSDISLYAQKLKEILEREAGLYEQLAKFLEKCARPDIDAIAVTHGPGLEPALWVGVNFAKALSLVWDIPTVAVNHMEGHFLISLLEKRDEEFQISNFKFPILGLLISGGHTELVLSREWMKYEILGETRDDAVGEAFDKVARMLGLPYPGGPHVSRLAEGARAHAFPSPVTLPRPMLLDSSYDFSFAGLKTAVRRLIGSRELSEKEKAEIAREFEDAVTDVLLGKTRRAIEEFGVKTLVVGGGVSANKNIRRRLESFSEKDCAVFFPSPEFATDNAVMIALAGYCHAQNRDFVNPDMLRADGNLRL